MTLRNGMDNHHKDEAHGGIFSVITENYPRERSWKVMGNGNAEIMPSIAENPDEEEAVENIARLRRAPPSVANRRGPMKPAVVKDKMSVGHMGEAAAGKKMMPKKGKGGDGGNGQGGNGGGSKGATKDTNAVSAPSPIRLVVASSMHKRRVLHKRSYTSVGKGRQVRNAPGASDPQSPSPSASGSSSAGMPSGSSSAAKEPAAQELAAQELAADVKVPKSPRKPRVIRKHGSMHVNSGNENNLPSTAPAAASQASPTSASPTNSSPTRPMRPVTIRRIEANGSRQFIEVDLENLPRESGEVNAGICGKSRLRRDCNC